MTYFIDIDGTLVKWGSSTPLPGAVDGIKRLIERGDRIVWITQRDRDSADFDNDAILELLQKITLPTPLVVLWGYGSPRIVVNDAGAYAIHHEMNAPWIETAQKLLEIPE